MTLPLKRNYKTDTTATLEKKISDWNSCRNICKCITATTNAYNTCVDCFQYFAQRELASRCQRRSPTGPGRVPCPQMVLRCSGANNTLQSLHYNQVLRRLQYNTMLVLHTGACAPTLQCNACTTIRCLDAYNTIQCLDYDQVLRRLIYCFAD